MGPRPVSKVGGWGAPVALRAYATQLKQRIKSFCLAMGLKRGGERDPMEFSLEGSIVGA
jgi:hypothetical protein